MLSLISILIVGCKDKEPTVKFDIDTTDIELSVGDTHEIDYTLTKGYELEWTVSKTGVISLDKGKIVAQTKGNVTITIKVKNANIEKKINVIVNEVAVESVEIDGSVEGMVGDTINLTATILPANATNKTVTYSSSNTNIATVDSNGVVSLLNKGTVVITAKAGNIEDTITITVNEVIVGVTGVEISGNVDGKIGGTITLTATVTPQNATDKTITWSSNNESIATVDSNGVVTLLAEGSTVITAKAGEVEDTLTITVTANTQTNVAYIGEVGYLTLEEALTAATANDTISLKAGTYDKDFTISKSNLTFTSVLGEKAIIAGKITIANGLTGIKFTNLEFTSKGQIYTGGTLDDFTFTNNKVYDSTIEATAYVPNNRTDVNAFIQLFTMTGTNIIGNVTITNNTFVNMPSDIISISRTSPNKTVNISNNEFRDFVIGAIRFDGGYNNGTYLLNNNLFENETFSGYNAILFRAYSPSSGNVQDIYIENNTFRNIGVAASIPADTYPGSAVIATSTFNDNPTNMYM